VAQPECGIVTTVGAVHTEFFESERAIAEEKATLVRRLPAEGTAILNRDNAFFDVLREGVVATVRTVSLSREADYQCVEWNPRTREARILERATGERVLLRMGLPGDFNVLNAMLAAAAARWLEVPWSAIGEVVHAYKGMRLRWEEREVAGIHVVNDAYNANPVNMRGSLRAFRDTADEAGQWLLLGGMLELGARERSEHLALGEEIGEGDWAGLIVVGEEAQWIADGAAKAGYPEARIFRCEDRDMALDAVRNAVEPGSRLLVKGSRRFQLETIIEKLETARR
jgi:UDP-N-acetylmuramoyl-tripeptide--D-alanyl-D-alanine ligase